MKLILFLLLLFIAIPISMLNGFVLSYLVLWFMNVHLGVVQAMGITLIVSMFTVSLKPRTDDAIEGLINSVLYSLVAWAFGFAYSYFL